MIFITETEYSSMQLHVPYSKPVKSTCDPLKLSPCSLLKSIMRQFNPFSITTNFILIIRLGLECKRDTKCRILFCVGPNSSRTSWPESDKPEPV